MLTRLYETVDSWRDAVVMKAALDVTNDAGASVPARVYALRHLIQLVNPGQYFGYGNLIVGDVPGQGANSNTITRGCHRMLASGRADVSATPLVSDYEQRIRAVATNLAGSSSAPVALRNAAACLDN